MTKELFLTAYEEHLKGHYAWAQDEAKRARYMSSVRATLDGANTWHADGPSVVAAWRSIGGTGKPSLKALRGLA